MTVEPQESQGIHRFTNRKFLHRVSLWAAIEITAGDRWKPVEKTKSLVRWMLYFGEITGENFTISPKWPLNGSKISQNWKIFPGLCPKPHHGGAYSASKNPPAKRFFIFPGDTNFLYFDHCDARRYTKQMINLHSEKSSQKSVASRSSRNLKDYLGIHLGHL